MNAATSSNPTSGWRHWGDLCTTDLASLDPQRTVAILPVAAIEQHGPHLPMSVDADILAGILQAAAPLVSTELPAYLLPSQLVGLSPEHQQFAGTLTLQPETALRLWQDIGASVARAGVRKLLIFNTHGGHISLMELAGRQMRAQHGLMVWGSSWFNLPLLDVHGQDLMRHISPEEQRFGVHAGQVETALMLALKPSAVRMNQAQAWRSTAQDRAQRFPLLGDGRSAKLYWQTQDYNPSGAVGNAAAASADWGSQVLQAAGRSLAQLVQEVSHVPLHD
jgi:creatinine amidohydrolase